MKRKQLIVIVTLCVMLILGVAAIASGVVGGTPRPFLNAKLGQALKQAKAVDKPDAIIGKVNGKSITRGMFAWQEAFMKDINEQQGKPGPSKEEIIEAIAKQLLILEEAEKQGISVSDHEIDQEIEKKRNDYDSATEENKAQLREFYAERGIDFDKHWTSKENKDAIRFRLITQKLVTKTVGQAQTPSKQEQAYKTFEDNLEQLYNQADIEVLE